MQLQSTLGFKIPERTAPPTDAFLLNPRAVADWISSLPIANVGETSRQVFKTIVEFNRLEIPGLSRIRSAEQFRQPIGYISENLQKYFIDTAFPLSAKNRKIAVLNRELYTELALSYKIYIESAIAGQSGKIDRKLLIIALHRALRYLSTVVFQCAIVYDPVPANTWREIHRLYAFAEKNGIHRQPVNEDGEKSEASTIGQLYKQILLFSVSSPYSMRQREIRLLIDSLDPWSRLARLESARVTQVSSCQFIARLGSDSPPLHHTLVEAGEEGHYRLLDTHQVVKLLADSVKDASGSSGTAGLHSTAGQLPVALMRQLSEALSTAPKRQFVRTRLNFELKIAVGISDINTLLDAGLEQAVIPPDQPTDSELAWLSKESSGSFGQSQASPTQGLALETYDVSIEETIVASSIEDAGFAYPFPASQGPSTAPPPQPDTFACKTVNESAGGYCINWQGLNAPKIKIGEVIGIQSASNSRQFSIGISRWMKNVPGQGLLLGMQMIASSSQAVLVHHLEGVQIADRPYKGLLLPAVRTSGQPATLVLPTLPFKSGSLVMINDGQEERKATLGRLLESTGAFTHFEFRYQARQGSRGNPHGDSEDFDNVRSML